MSTLTINDILLSSLVEFILFASRILSPSLCKWHRNVTEQRVNTPTLFFVQDVWGLHKSRKSYGDLSLKLIEITDGFSLFRWRIDINDELPYQGNAPLRRQRRRCDERCLISWPCWHSPRTYWRWLRTYLWNSLHFNAVQPYFVASFVRSLVCRIRWII
jgi:hypothetical protein